MKKIILLIILIVLLLTALSSYAAIDTRDKRASVIMVNLPFGRVLPTPEQ